MSKHNYSSWMKIDLHIHSDWSRKTKTRDYQGNFSIEVLKEKLKSNEVWIFSLTDHNIINLPAYIAYYATYDPINDPLLLVGVELDIIVENGSPQTYHSLLIFNYCDTEKATSINERLENKYAEKGIEDLKRELTIDEIVEIFPDDDFFFIPHAGNTKSILDSYKGQLDNAQKMVLLMQSAFEKVPQKNIYRYNEGFDKHLIEAFRNKEDNAYIRFSDNHNATNYPCTGKNGDDHIFYYIKGSKNFETLRLAFIDPKSRIKSSEQYSELLNQTNYIEKIKISEDTIFSETDLTFSPHLNVLIGGRSSGKSLMMTALGEKIDGVNNANNFYKADFSKAQIKSKVDATFQLITAIGKEEITYINQNEIVSLFEKKDLEELAKAANKLEFYNFEKRKFSDHKTELIDKVEEVMEAYNFFGSNDLHKKFVLHATTIENLLKKEYILNFQSAQLKKKHDWNQEIQDSSDNLENLTASIAEFKKNEFLEIDDEDEIIINNFEALLLKKEEVLKEKKLILFRKNQFIDNTKLLIDSCNLQLSSNAQKKVESTDILTNLKNEVETRFQKLIELKLVTESLEKFDYHLEKEIDITEEVKLILEVENIGSLKELVLDGIKNSSNEKNVYSNLIGLLRGEKSIKNHDDNSTDNLRQKIKRQLKTIYNSLEAPRDYLKYKDGGSSKRNSPGYNSEKYLDIILKTPNSKIIFIDQPEDNLGNRFIAETLVDNLRQIKFKKQIFLVTHNPSIVVYGDAENVIIANNDGDKISYKQHVLEDQTAQREICKILDGGQYIFDMRSKKYNIQKLLKDTNNE